jgi:CDGSH-type Zn-finger protein
VTGRPEVTGNAVSVSLCPAGPLLVRGADSVRDGDGVEHPVTRPVVAVCVCGKSSRQPWCDATHKAIPRFRSVT